MPWTASGQWSPNKQQAPPPLKQAEERPAPHRRSSGRGPRAPRPQHWHCRATSPGAS
uniref:Treacle ribosome biogenesis factor 1 n=1 Tax=Molossus molossus TaxID=27622 RepID=A0A7J8IE22_MOLMO|nr:treacle ribosome biogenesis factor 1 [Molossus molossus]